MYFFSKVFKAARTWRQGRRPKPAKRRAVAVEYLDYRRLLSINFTGNVTTDFPATESPGVVYLTNVNPPPTIPAPFSTYIKQSGYAISAIAVSYDSTDNTLSIGFESPPADTPSDPTGEVIAGDADDNGSTGNVNPKVFFLDPAFTEYPALEGSQIEMYSFLDLGNTGTPDVVAGFSPNQPAPSTNPAQSPLPSPVPKPYQVAQAIPSGMPNVGPGFGTLLTNNTGNYYLANDALHPNLEFTITNFSQLYQAETGHALTPSSVIGIGAFAGNDSDGGIPDVYVPEQTFTLAQATVPVTPPEPSPPILINPHEHRIIDTGHRDLVRVSIFGTSGFPVSEINPASVELDGVTSIAHITRKIQRDEFPFQTYVFVADQLNLPAGLTTATLTGTTNSGVTFETQKDVLNLPHSALAFGKLKKYMGNASYYERLAKLEASNPSIGNAASNATVSLASPNAKAKGAAAVQVNYTPKVSATGSVDKVKVRPVVAIKRAETAQEQNSVPTRVRYSMEHHLSLAG